MKCRLTIQVDPEDLAAARRRGARWPGDVLVELRGAIRAIAPRRAEYIRIFENPLHPGGGREFLLTWTGRPLETGPEAARRTS